MPKRNTTKQPKKQPKKRPPVPKRPRKPKAPASVEPLRAIYDGFVSRLAAGKTLKPSEIKLFRQIESDLEAANGTAPGQPKPKGNIIASMDEAAAYIGSSRRIISLHIKQGKLKQNTDGTFSRADLDKWLARYGRKGGSSEEIESIREQQEKAELRYRIARARREEVLTAQLEKTMAPWSEIESEWAERVRLVTSGLEDFGNRLPAVLVGKLRDEIAHILRIEVRELRERYARPGRYCPAGRKK